MFYNEEQEKIIEKIPDTRIIYCIVAGMTFREIAEKFYLRNINKVVYRIRQIYKEFNLINRRHLAYFVVTNDIIDPKLLRNYKNA